MSPYILHVDAAVLCAHTGTAKPPTGDPRVQVAGKQVVTGPTVYTVSACKQPPPTAGNGPCATATWTAPALRVRAGGFPLLLATSQATCLPTGTPLSVVATQIRVKAT